MNIRMAAVAVCALTLGVTPAAADIIGTISALPSVIQAGETTTITLSVSGFVTTNTTILAGFIGKPALYKMPPSTMALATV